MKVYRHFIDPQLRGQKSTPRIAAFKFESNSPNDPTKKRGKKGIKKSDMGSTGIITSGFTTKLYCTTLVFIPLINIGTFTHARFPLETDK